MFRDREEERESEQQTLEIFIGIWPSDKNLTESIQVKRRFMHHIITYEIHVLQGLPGEKGQKGDLGQPAIDVFQAVKVFSFCSFQFIYSIIYFYNI